MKQISQYGEAVRTALAGHVAEFGVRPEADNPWTQDYLKRLAPFVTQGKQLRGGLVCWTYETFAGRQPSRAAMRTAMALELCHSSLLVHDDIIDNDPIRRGQPAWHKQYEQLGIEHKLSEPAWFGSGMAICAGDMGLLMSFNLLATLSLPTDISETINRQFTAALLQVFAGQMEDVYLDASPRLPAKSAIYRVMEYKTASYSLTLPLLLGARLAGAPEAVSDQLKALGTAAGTIFQIRDDELGLTGNSDRLGKPVGSDIREGKKTLPYYYLIRQANSGEKQRLVGFFGRPGTTDKDVAYVRRLALKYDIGAQLAAEIGRFTKQATAVITELPITPVAKSELRKLVIFCASRQT